MIILFLVNTVAILSQKLHNSHINMILSIGSFENLGIQYKHYHLQLLFNAGFMHTCHLLNFNFGFPTSTSKCYFSHKYSLLCRIMTLNLTELSQRGTSGRTWGSSFCLANKSAAGDYLSLHLEMSPMHLLLRHVHSCITIASSIIWIREIFSQSGTHISGSSNYLHCTNVRHNYSYFVITLACTNQCTSSKPPSEKSEYLCSSDGLPHRQGQAPNSQHSHFTGGYCQP